MIGMMIVLDSIHKSKWSTLLCACDVGISFNMLLPATSSTLRERFKYIVSERDREHFSAPCASLPPPSPPPPHNLKKKTHAQTRVNENKNQKQKQNTALYDNCFECFLSHLYWSYMSEVDLRCSRPIKNNYYYSTKRFRRSKCILSCIFACHSIRPHGSHQSFLSFIPSTVSTIVSECVFFLLLLMFIHVSGVCFFSLVIPPCDHSSPLLHYYLLFLFVSLSLLLLINKKNIKHKMPTQIYNPLQWKIQLAHIKEAKKATIQILFRSKYEAEERILRVSTNTPGLRENEQSNKKEQHWHKRVKCTHTQQ